MKRLSVRSRLQLGTTSKPTTASFLAARLDPSSLSLPLLAPEPVAGTYNAPATPPTQLEEHHPLPDEAHLLASLDQLTVQPAVSYGDGDPPSGPRIALPVNLRVSYSTSFNLVAPEDYCEAYPRVLVEISRDEELGRIVVLVRPGDRGFTWSKYHSGDRRVTAHIRLANGKLARGIGKGIPAFTLTAAEIVEYDPATGSLRCVMPDYSQLRPPKGGGGTRQPHERKGPKRPAELPRQRVNQQPSAKTTQPDRTKSQPEWDFGTTQSPPQPVATRSLPSLEELRSAAQVLKRAKLAHPNDITFRIDVTTGMLAVHVTVDLLS